MSWVVSWADTILRPGLGSELDRGDQKRPRERTCSKIQPVQAAGGLKSAGALTLNQGRVWVATDLTNVKVCTALHRSLHHPPFQAARVDWHAATVAGEQEGPACRFWEAHACMQARMRQSRDSGAAPTTAAKRQASRVGDERLKAGGRARSSSIAGAPVVDKNHVKSRQQHC